MTQLTLAGCTGIVLPPDWEDGRGSWCTPKKYAEAVGYHWLDPFSNSRSHVLARLTCELERGDDGFGFGDPQHAPGSFYTQAHGYQCASAVSRVWLQPPYDIVLAAIAHYKHTRFTALLRLDPSTEWFDELHAASELILVPRGDRIEFDPPPGVKASSNPFPHGFFYKHAADATQAIRDLCFEWRLR
jgi:hypothetical protein